MMIPVLIEDGFSFDLAEGKVPDFMLAYEFVFESISKRFLRQISNHQVARLLGWTVEDGEGPEQDTETMVINQLIIDRMMARWGFEKLMRKNGNHVWLKL